MNRESKRPRIIRPGVNRDENRQGGAQNFGSREGGDRGMNRFGADRPNHFGSDRPNRFDMDRPNREPGYGYIRDLNKERAQERTSDSGGRDYNRFYRDSDQGRGRGERDGNRFENRDIDRSERKLVKRDGDHNRFPDRGEQRERRPLVRREGGERPENRFPSRERSDFRGGDRREGGFQGGDRREGGYPSNRREYDGNRDGGFRGDRRDNEDRRGGGFQGDRREGGERREGGFSGNRREYDGNRTGGFRDDRRGGGFNTESRDRRGGDDRRGGFSDRPERRSFSSRSESAGGGNSVYSKKKQIEYKKKNEDQETELRLNRFIAKGGVCSRRDADELIVAGKVKVNGEIVQQLGVKVKRTDSVEVDGHLITPERRVYMVLNKPKDYVTTVEDPLERQTVMSLIEGACKERVYPVGRLDRQTTGVLLFTNDGDLAKKLTHPKYNQKKIYHVFLDKVVQAGDLEMILKGIELEDGLVQADDVQVMEDDHTQVGIEIHSGRNRIVRRIFEHLGYQILRLDRVFFAGITKKNLPRGHWRFLTQDEINVLKAY